MSATTTNLKEAIVNRRSIRKVTKNDAITKERIEEVLKTALHAPTSFNMQSGRMVVLMDGEHEKFWDIVKETTKNTIANPWTITNSVYTVDPAIAMAETVANAKYADFTPAGIVATIKALGNGFTVSESDIAIDGDTATVRFLYGYSEKTVTISK